MKNIIALMCAVRVGLNFALSAMTINKAIQNQSEDIRGDDENPEFASEARSLCLDNHFAQRTMTPKGPSRSAGPIHALT
jgi:hypothetical protein